MASLAILICEVGRRDKAQCTDQLQAVLRKLLEPYQEKITWIRTEQGKMQQEIKEQQINMYIYDYANDYIALITELFIHCEELAQEPFDPRFPLDV